ncbi:D-alanine--poly(phosphoribitol) ligase subunit 2 [Kordia antarctica]|uniref:D-alanine--poly(Phosphoribitol) ligase subunit 2 n=1 Tax=Kordia antarctica TaxID=1218801 RepID=A0A7L4ZFB4_9FLAO|nr:phosphopantetheine-binding protein [Kordia antarctica]QHI35418.1 D-alanine--poly(phosphoribitol) ligase subunit 2 [Kordia antarctica]
MKEKFAIILSEILENTITPENIPEDVDLISYFEITSLNMIYLMLEIENVFDVEVNLEEVDVKTFFTYKSIKEFIEREQS